jgi:2-polyprenyl-3-methyl-5-hydroxy-6-metoxy-1,4-benzoquinol methylase
LEFGALRSDVAKRTRSPLNFRGVNFTEQEKYLRGSRVWAAVCVFCVVAAATYAWKISGITARTPVIIFAAVIVAICGSLFYTPDYLHLNVNRTKRFRWQIKIRWRLIGVGLIFGLVSASSLRGGEIVLASCVWLILANLIAKRATSAEYSSVYFWFTDSLLLGTLFWTTGVDFVVAVALIMASLHLAIVAIERPTLGLSILVALPTARFIFDVGEREHARWDSSTAFGVVVAVATLGTILLVMRSQKQNTRNFVAAKSELKEFTGYSDDKIRELWATSNEQLAKNWKDAHLDESDREKMTAWYRENSELYMFAISGYNLEYKRIRDSIKMLRYGRGACLDYGAGNGEIILELARRGHAAIYFDVDGTSMRFARFRAERRKLAVEFFHSKDDLAASAKQRGLDTIFSFDVLEHLPDLPGELKFLSSLLNPGGRMAFDVPAGTTKAHPMHLNHHLEVNAYMKSIGMVEERGLMESIPFKKQEKYVFRKPA